MNSATWNIEQMKQMFKPMLKQPWENNQMKKENWDLIIPLVPTAPQTFLATNRNFL